MEVENLIESFSEFKQVKNIDRETMMNILEDVFKSVLDKKYEEQGNFDVIINVDKGDLEIWKNREVVKDSEVENPIAQIALSDALKIEDDYEVGEEVAANFNEKAKRKLDNGKWKVGLHEQIFIQLIKIGIPLTNIKVSDICTFESLDCHSYRRDGKKAGRMIAFMGLRL